MTLVILVVVIITGFIIHVWHMAYTDKKTYFYITCPVCGHEQGFRRAWIREHASKKKPTEIFTAETPCAKNRGGCGADLSGLYISHPFVRECLEGAERLRMQNAEGRAFAESLEQESVSSIFDPVAPIEEPPPPPPKKTKPKARTSTKRK